MEDTEIIAKILEGDKAQFAYLVDKYKNKISGVVYNYLGALEDIEGSVQETFLRAYKQLGTLSEPRQFGGWLVRIARNLCIDKLRKRKEKVQSLEYVEEKGIQIEAPPSTPIQKMIEEENLKNFQEAFDSLHSDYRELLTLKNFCHLSYKEIEQITGHSKSKIGELLFKGRNTLREALKKRSS